MKNIIIAVLLWLGMCAAQAAVTGKAVEYKADGQTLKGYLAYDDAIKGKRPAVLVVHEWWGHNNYARKRAEMLAGMGYIALALDMYGDGKQADHPKDAGKFSAEVRNNLNIAHSRFMAAMTLIKQQPETDSSRIAAIGYCFGGAVVLEMARMGLDIAGVASFHGSLDTAQPARPGMVKANMFVANGADDRFVPAAQIEQFKQEMDNAKVNYQFKSYPGAKHSFTNPDADVYGKKFNIPLEYNEQADKASWLDLGMFLDRIFGKRVP